MFLREHPEGSSPGLLHEHLIIQLDYTLYLELLLQVLDLLVEPPPLIVSLTWLGREGLHLAKQVAGLLSDVFETLLLTGYQTLVETLNSVVRGLELGTSVN